MTVGVLKDRISTDKKPPSLFASPEKRRQIFSLLLVVAILLLYNQVNHFSFVNFDDQRYVTENPHLRSGLSWSTLTWAFTSTADANWHPLTWLSHVLDYQLFKLNPAGPHLINVFLHAANAVLLFLLLARGTGRVGPSFVVAALFAVHPINVESVAWISERKNVLSTLFFLLTLGAYAWYALRPGWKRYLAVAGLFACGLASKSMLVTLPFVLLLLDYWPLRRISRSDESRSSGRDPVALAMPHTTVPTLILEKLPLLGLSIAVSAVTLVAQQGGGAVRASSLYPLSVRLENAICSYARYVQKAFWPTNLAALYPYPESLALWKVTLAAFFLVSVTLLAFRLHSRRYLLTGWLFFLGTLVPVIGLVQVGSQAMADRYAYIPLLGIFVMTVWGATDFAEWKKLNSATTSTAACILLALAALTYRQLGYWKDSMTLWSHALAVTKNNFFAEDGLGGALLLEGRLDEAYSHYQRAAAIMPNEPMSHANIGAYLQQRGRLREAIQQYEIAIPLCGDSRLRAAIYVKLGSAYQGTGHPKEAERSFDTALELDPTQFSAWLAKGDLALQQSKPDNAIQDFSRSLQLQPTDAGYLGLGRALAQAGRPTEALAAYQQALEISPDLTEAKQAVAALSSGRHLP